ncbi:HU family DNA-binding protein [Parabacteroides bouchesdurhonensis]|uniref:HU family DNA-binding protein n=1 Tax=Parabacteroides bouchesdurhonensis TaxID=1936995 RepID=UPI000C85C6CC|nr:HU family DNA-binding protein [Parabacteroides bouchesdurhonensis]
MNNRLSIPEMAGLLAGYTGKTKKEAEAFLKAFVSVVTKGVFADKIVKVKGLGTFKIIPVEQRESIHVNTGERFLIPKHYKFSFVPDKELKELVNKPFSFFESAEVNENVEFSDIDESIESEENKLSEDESVEDVLPDKELPVTDVQETTKAPAAPVVEETEKLPEEESAEPSSSIPEPVETQVTKEEHIHQPQSEIITEEEVEEPDYSFHDAYSGAEGARHSVMKYTVVAIFSLALISIIGIYLYLNFNSFVSYSYKGGVAKIEVEGDSLGELLTDSLRGESADTLDLALAMDTIEQEVAVQEETPVVKEEKTEEATPAPAPVKKQPEIKQQPEQQKTVSAQSSRLPAKVTIKAGDRLTVISLENYGSKVFWVYLYEHNKNVISDPNNVPIGTEIVVPAPELYGIDAHSRESLDKAAALQARILSEAK